MTTPRSHTPRSRIEAFTLIELLTVIAIIGILAAIIIPVVGKVRETARASTCASNLRQIGMGIQLYAQANRDRLPGPLWGSQGARFSATSTGVLSQFLEPYITSNTPTGSGTTKAQEMFNCPAWVQNTPDLTKPSMALNIRPKGWVTGDTLYPFGYPTPVQQPLSQVRISSYPLSRTWLMTDLDQVWNPAYSPLTDLPAKPVHGNSRNVLFYDGHVAKLEASQGKPTDW